MTFGEYAKQLRKEPPVRGSNHSVRKVEIAPPDDDSYDEYVFTVNRLEQKATNNKTCGACGKYHPPIDCYRLIYHVVSDIHLKDSPSFRLAISKNHRQYVDRSAYFNKARDKRAQRPPISRRVN